MATIKFFLYLVLFMPSVSISCSAKLSANRQLPVEVNSISGQIKGLPKGMIQLIMEEDVNRKKNRLIAEIPIDVNGNFKLEKALSPHIYSLKLNDQKSVMLAVGQGQQIIITGDANGLQVAGSEDTKKLEAYEQFRKESLNRLVITIRNQIRDIQEKGMAGNESKLHELTKLEIENYNKHKDELIEFIKAEMGTSIAIYPTSIRWSGDKNIPFLIELAKQFEKAHPNTEIAARINEKVQVIVANSIGGKVPEIKMPDASGKIVSLTSIKAKYILIDFWASWCAPCRRESVLLGELYTKYKAKGLEIYGVGLESSKEIWIKAIEKDKRTWINVSTFQQFESPVAFQYAVTALPANVLIDNSGKVVARDLHGDELKNRIEKLFLNK
jgi:thiol-disulfide isomerase/thioredoxin